MKATLWLGATALAAALAAGSALAAGDTTEKRMQQGAAAGSSSDQMMQHDQATVRQAQEALKEKGYDVGEVDGMWGPQTQAALRQYQEQEGLTPSGELDSQTIAELGLEDGAAAGRSGAGVAAGAGSTSPSGERPLDEEKKD